MKDDFIIRFADRLERVFKHRCIQYVLNYTGLFCTLCAIVGIFVANGYFTCPSLYTAEQCTGPLTFGYFVLFEMFVNFFLFHYCKKYNRVDSLLPNYDGSSDHCRKNIDILPTIDPNLHHNNARYAGSRSGVCSTRAETRDSGTRPDIKFCVTCDMPVPWRSHHCPVCDYCILRKDHHCYFMGGCVGFGNQRYFIIFLFWAFVGAAYASSLALRYLDAFYVQFWPFGWIEYIFPLAMKKWLFFQHCTFPQLAAVFLCSAGVSAAGVSLLFSLLQWILIYKGKTFMEQNSRATSTDLGQNSTFCQNVRVIFGPYWILNYLIPLPFKNKWDESFKKWLYDVYVKEL